MAFSRKLLKSLGLSDEVSDSLIEEHMATVNAIKAERDKLQASGEELQTANARIAELEKLVKSLEAAAADAAKVQADFDAYRTEVETRASNERKAEALWQELSARKANPDAREMLMYGVDLAKVELDDEGKLKDAEQIVSPIVGKYGKYFGVDQTSGTPPMDPPSGGTTAGSMSKDQIMAIRDPAARQKAIAEHLDLFTRH